MGSGPVDRVADPGWFEFYDDTIEVDPSSVAGRAFLAGLRARAVSHAWPCDPYDTWTYHAIDDDQHLLRVGVWLHVWLTCGLEFDGTRIVGGDVYSEIPFDLEGLHPDAAMEHSGSVEFLMERAVEWFEWLLSWPIERREWFENGELVFKESVLASTERKLTAQTRPQPARPPDRVTLVRGVRESGTDRDGGRKRWGFGKRRGK
jgi:hypothetical protein